MLTEDELKKINELNDAVKDLDSVLKEKVIQYGLSRIFKDDYQKFFNLSKQSEFKSRLIDKDNIDDTSQNEPAKEPNLKEFFDQKAPLTSSEIVTVFGFYLEHYRNIKEFSEKEIADCYYEARTRKPKVISQALRDAKNQKDYLVEGTKKGKFRVSNVGENLVIHDLPRIKKG